MNDFEQSIYNMFSQAANKKTETTTSTASRDSSSEVVVPGENYRYTKQSDAGIDPEVVKDNPYLENLDFWQQLSIQKQKQNPALHQNEYLPKGSRQTNINTMNHEDSLKYSRLADALNNRYYLQGRQGSTLRGGLMGQGVVGSGVDYGSLYQMPVETEEMRQIARMRDYEQAVRSREIGRQQDTKDAQLIQEMKKFEERLSLSGKYSEEQIRRMMEKWMYELGYDQMARDYEFQRYLAEINKIHIPQKQAEIVASFVQRNPTKANLFAALFGIAAGAPDVNTDRWSKRQADIIEKGEEGGWTDDQITKELGAEAVKQGFEYFSGVFSEALGPDGVKAYWNEIMKSAAGN